MLCYVKSGTCSLHLSLFHLQYDTKDSAPDSPVSLQNKDSAAAGGVSGSKSRKRKRLRENLAQLASEGELVTPMYKRRSSDMGLVSFGQSFLDVTPDVSGYILAGES